MAQETPHSLRVVARWDAAEDLVGLRALPADAGLLGRHRIPGQYLVVRTAPDAAPVFLALAGAPGDDAFELLIKTGGGGAADEVAAVSTGAALLASEPAGPGFPVERLLGRDVLLAAAGSGIAPIRAVIQWMMAERGRVGRVGLYWGVRSPAHLPYRDELEAWRSAGIGVELVYGLAPSGEPGHRVQDVLAGAAFDPERTSALLCGMRPMVEAVREVLVGRGIAPDAVHLNH